MAKGKTPEQATLKEEDIVSTKKISRRSLLASTGVGVAVGVAALVAASAKKAHAGGDAKNADNDIPTPIASDPDRDY